VGLWGAPRVTGGQACRIRLGLRAQTRQSGAGSPLRGNKFDRDLRKRKVDAATRRLDDESTSN